MAKAINWPADFLDEILKENNEDIKVAFRLGSIYFDHQYYIPDEIVDIRCNHKVVRQGVIAGDMKLCKIKELTENILNKQKQSLKDTETVIKFLNDTYQQETSPETLVTVVFYKNLPLETEENKVDDPHM